MFAQHSKAAHLSTPLLPTGEARPCVRLRSQRRCVAGCLFVVTVLSVLLTTFSKPLFFQGLGDSASSVNNELKLGCLAPIGEYTGQDSVMGYTVFVQVIAMRAIGEMAGELEVVAATGNLISFACNGERWVLEHHERVLVERDKCWKDNVEGNIDKMSMHWIGRDNAILLRGRHRIAWFISIPLEMILTSQQPEACIDRSSDEHELGSAF
mmetsp:Transcript_58317/g.96279  ORF Transcript_58317/g.96279 Transcript_58317/m.96279 type:complete len:210 (-) Transcript_58317:264-893(-)